MWIFYYLRCIFFFFFFIPVRRTRNRNYNYKDVKLKKKKHETKTRRRSILYEIRDAIRPCIIQGRGINFRRQN